MLHPRVKSTLSPSKHHHTSSHYIIYSYTLNQNECSDSGLLCVQTKYTHIHQRHVGEIQSAVRLSGVFP